MAAETVSLGAGCLVCVTARGSARRGRGSWAWASR